MGLQTKTNLFLAGIGVLLLVIGGLGVYVFVEGDNDYDDNYQIKTSTTDNATVDEDDDDEENSTETPITIEPRVFEYLNTIKLPAPDTVGEMSVETALQSRRSRREFADTNITLSQLGQMLWAGQGITNDVGGRTAPSSHSAYKLRLFAVVDRVDGLEQGVYEYLPKEHALGKIKDGDQSDAWEAMSGQKHPQNAAVTIMVAANLSDPDSQKALYQESGHVGQNFYLQTEALNLAMLVMGGFDAEPTSEFLGLNEAEKIIYFVPLGNRAIVSVTE